MLQILNNDTNIRNADAELQQRTVEYLQLSKIASADILATVLEEMPAFPERESSILAKLKKKKELPDEGDTPKEIKHLPQAIVNNAEGDTVRQRKNITLDGCSCLFCFLQTPERTGNMSQAGSTDLLGLNSPTSAGPPVPDGFAQPSSGSMLLDVFDLASNGPGSFTNGGGTVNGNVQTVNEANLKKLV